MKPDWQNKSYAKTSSPSAPSTMNPKLKVGMSTLHSKISQANNNMPQAPKPVVRKFADGGSVRTRSDDEIGDTDPRTGKVDPGSYDRRMKAGEENLNRLKSAVESVRSFFTRDKQAESSPSNITGDSGMSDSDVAKKNAMSGGMGSEKKAEPVAEVKAEEPRRKIEDYMVKKEPESAAVVQSNVNSQAALAPAPAAASNAASSNAASSNAAAVVNKAAPVVAPVKKKKPAKVDRSNKAGQSQKDIEALVLQNKGLAGNEVMKKQVQQPSTTTKPSGSGRVPTSDQAAANRQALVDKAKSVGTSVVDYIKNFETPAERRSRLAKEAAGK
jgi:hypothetical protein